jgi:hypothetical protein
MARALHLPGTQADTATGQQCRREERPMLLNLHIIMDHLLISTWRRRRYIPPKSWYTATIVHGATTQEINVYINTITIDLPFPTLNSPLIPSRVSVA